MSEKHALLAKSGNSSMTISTTNGKLSVRLWLLVRRTGNCLAANCLPWPFMTLSFRMKLKVCCIKIELKKFCDNRSKMRKRKTVKKKKKSKLFRKNMTFDDLTKDAFTTDLMKDCVNRMRFVEKLRIDRSSQSLMQKLR